MIVFFNDLIKSLIIWKLLLAIEMLTLSSDFLQRPTFSIKLGFKQNILTKMIIIILVGKK